MLLFACSVKWIVSLIKKSTRTPTKLRLIWQSRTKLAFCSSAEVYYCPCITFDKDRVTHMTCVHISGNAFPTEVTIQFTSCLFQSFLLIINQRKVCTKLCNGHVPSFRVGLWNVGLQWVTARSQQVDHGNAPEVHQTDIIDPIGWGSTIWDSDTDDMIWANDQTVAI